MPLTPRIKPTPTPHTHTPTPHVLLNTRHILAPATQHRALAPAAPWPHPRHMIFQPVVAADAGVELAAARVLDGDDVEGGVPVRALGEGGCGDAVDVWGWWYGSSSAGSGGGSGDSGRGVQDRFGVGGHGGWWWRLDGGRGRWD